jgi:hypothetical protein
MMFYALKIPEDQFKKVLKGRKYIKFKTEHNNFSIGDKLTILGYSFDIDYIPTKYQGESMICFVNCVMTNTEYPFAVKEGYVLIGIEVVERIHKGIVLQREENK